MKDARIRERYRRTITSHRAGARGHTYNQHLRACDVVLWYPSSESIYSELLRRLLYGAVGLHHLHKGKRPIELLCALCIDQMMGARRKMTAYDSAQAKEQPHEHVVEHQCGALPLLAPLLQDRLLVEAVGQVIR